MSKVQLIEAELQKLSADEIREVRDWLNDFPVSQPEFVDSHFMTLREDVAAGVAQVRTGKTTPFDEAAAGRIKAKGRQILDSNK